MHTMEFQIRLWILQLTRVMIGLVEVDHLR